MPGHLQKHHQESSQSGEQVSCKGGTVELVDCMDEAKFGRPECRLIEDALEQFTLSYDHLKVKEEQEAGEQVMIEEENTRTVCYTSTTTARRAAQKEGSMGRIITILRKTQIP